MASKKSFYEVTKHYRNGADKYYIEIYMKDLTEYLLERIGEHTKGGSEYGYNITTKKIKKLPKGAELFPRTITYYDEIY